MKHFATSLLCVALLAGCGSLPPERRIRIDLPGGGTSASLAGLTIDVHRLESRGVLQEHNLAYSDSGAPEDVKQALTIIWDESPEEAAGAYLAETLRRAGATVLVPGTPGIAAQALTGMVERFELVDGGGTGIATVALDITVTDSKTAKPWLHASYCAKAPARDQTLRSVALAFDAALADLSSHLVGDLEARAKGGPAPAFAPHGSRLAPC